MLPKQGKTNDWSPLHIVCDLLSVYPGLQMHCYLRVWIPPVPVILAGGPGRGDQKLTWGGGDTNNCACLAQTESATEEKHSFVVHNNKLDCVSFL